jgi:hypothetical protein
MAEAKKCRRLDESDKPMRRFCKRRPGPRRKTPTGFRPSPRPLHDDLFGTNTSFVMRIRLPQRGHSFGTGWLGVRSSPGFTIFSTIRSVASSLSAQTGQTCDSARSRLLILLERGIA